jgi:hypothetical protein
MGPSTNLAIDFKHYDILFNFNSIALQVQIYLITALEVGRHKAVAVLI